MTKFFIIVLSFLSVNMLKAQSYAGPESVDYYPANDLFVVSNSGNGQILTSDISGNLSLLCSGIDVGPHGLEVVQDVVYACSGGNLKGYDINSGNQVLNYSLGGQFLNGITYHDGYLYLTDFSAKRLYQYNLASESHTLFASFNSTPNGVVYDYLLDRLIVVGWGSNAPIWEVSLSDASVTVLSNTNHYNIDGIALDPCGNYYVSVWGNNAIYQYNSDFSIPQVLTLGQNQPADIFYESNNQVLAVPNSGNNSVNFISINCNPSTILENISEKFSQSDEQLIFNDLHEKVLYNELGQELWRGKQSKLYVGNLKTGVYILKGRNWSQKVFIP